MTYRVLNNKENIVADLGHPIDYFKERDIFLDVRGKIKIDATSIFGFGIKILTQSHYRDDLMIVKDKEVIVHGDTFIGSFSLLYNCIIGAGSILAAGTVVRNRDVPDYCMAEGNPCQIIARYDIGRKKWAYLDIPEEIKPKRRK